MNFTLFLSVICILITNSYVFSQNYIRCLAIAKTNPDIIYAVSGKEIFKTTNAGISWINKGNVPYFANAMNISPSNTEVIYAGTENGMYKCEDGGVTWQEKGLRDAVINTIAIDPSNPDILYVGTGKFGLQPDTEITGIFKTTDGGDGWEEIYSEKLDKVWTLCIDSDSSSIIYAGLAEIGIHEYGFLKSTNYGDSWTSGDFNPSSSANEVEYLIMSSSNINQPVLYGTESNEIYKSTDKGENWTRTKYNTPFEFPYRSTPRFVAVDHDSSNHIYAGTYLTRTTWPVVGDWHSEFYKSTDSGENWIQKDDNLPEVSITCAVIDPRNGHIYVGMNPGGIFKSQDGADSWDLVVGVDEKINISNVPKQFLLFQNYPNPFNPSTIIHYSITSSEFVSLKIYDLLGREIRTLVNEYKRPGSYSVIFKANQLPSGVYFYRLNVENKYTASKKMLLMR